MNLPSSPRLAPDSPQLHLIEAACAVLGRDPRVVAAWIGGSIAAGTADRWSDVDLRLAVEESDLAAVVDAMPETLAAIHPVLGWLGRPVRGGHLVVVTFEGPLRADLELALPAALRGPRHEAVAPLIDPRGQVAEFAGASLTPRLLAPAELIEREAARIPAELGRLQRAIEDRSILAATHAQTTLLESAQRLLLLLRDPRAAGLAGPKHAAEALTAADVEPLLDPLRAWSTDWPAPVVDSIDPTLELLQPLVAEVRNRHGTAMPLHPEPPDPEGPAAGSSDFTRSASAEAVEAAHNLLVHAMVGAGYYNRGLYTGVLWAYAMAGQLAAELARVRPKSREISARLTPADAAALESALRPLRRGGVEAVRLIAANVAALYSRYLERACDALGLTYRRRLDRTVNAYLFGEGVFAYDVTAANPAP
ncbi:MAG: nucleotidyltransferase domain-containing protein [Chloroflexota bacterium]|nr:nucleotidyltransferase domain-containing protein [Chloroflexota bacterium]